MRENYTKSPLHAYELMKDERLTVLDKLVWCYIQAKVNRDNKISRQDHRIKGSTAIVNIARITEELNVKRKEVESSLELLLELGYLTVTKQSKTIKEVSLSNYSNRHREDYARKKAEKQEVKPLSGCQLDKLADMFNNETRPYMDEVDTPNHVIANYMLDIAKKDANKKKTYKCLVEEMIHGYAWDLSPWLVDPRPYKLFRVYDYYETYNKLTSEEKSVLRNKIASN